MARLSNIKAYLQHYTNISLHTLHLGFLCWQIFNYNQMISVFLSWRFKWNAAVHVFLRPRLVIWAGAGVWRVLEPRLLGVKGLSLRAGGKLTRQAWVCQWQAPGRKLVWVHGHLSSCSCMTLTTATTRQAIPPLLSGAVLPWCDACRPFRGTEEEKEGRKCVCSIRRFSAGTHVCICACHAAKTCTCMCVWLNLCLPVHAYMCVGTLVLMLH